MTPQPLVARDRATGVTTLTLDDGKANVMNVEMLRALDAALTRAQAESAAVVLTAKGRAFSGGFDLGAFRRDRRELAKMLEAGARLTARLLAYPRPVVAACNGHAIAMGAFLLLAADARLCAAADLRIQLNEVQIGLTMPRFAIALCRQRLAPAGLHASIVTSRPFGAAEAVAAGFVDELVEPGGLLPAAQALAGRLAALPAPAFEATKRRLAQPLLRHLEEAIADDLAEWRATGSPSGPADV